VFPEGEENEGCEKNNQKNNQFSVNRGDDDYS